MRELYGKKNKLFYLDAMEWYAAKWEAYKDMDIIYPPYLNGGKGYEE
jgi:hypothetical protein